MNKILTALLLMSVLAAPAAPPPAADEEALIKVLQSPAAPEKKAEACQQLKEIATVKSIPALAGLLLDEHLYQSACDVLETLPVKAAGEALHAALKKTSGAAKTGVIHSLGERRHRAAVSDLARFLRDGDPLFGAPAARALGEIGGNESVRALRQARQATKSDSLRGAATDGLLRCATQFAAEGETSDARKIFQELNTADAPQHIRTAAYEGLIRLADKGALELVIAGIVGEDPAAQVAALQLAGVIQAASAPAAFTNLLPRVAPPVQISLLRTLERRGAGAAAPAVYSLARNDDADVRVAAIAALGALGDATLVPFLAEAATSRYEPQQKAARQALIALRRGDVSAVLLRELRTASPEIQAELAQALGGRWEKSAVPALIDFTQSPVGPTRRAAFRALNQLADETHLPGLVKLMAAADNDATRGEVRDVFESIVQRTDAGKSNDVSAIVAGLATAGPETRIALLQVSTLFADERLRTAFRGAVQDPDEKIRTAAERAMCQSHDPALLPDLLEFARAAVDSNLRALALEGYVRLAGGEESPFPPRRRVELLTPAFNLAPDADGKKMVLSALGKVRHPDALKLVESATDAAVREEAEVAGLQIATALLPVAPKPAELTLERLSAAALSGDVRTNATTTLKNFRTPPPKD